MTKSLVPGLVAASSSLARKGLMLERTREWHHRSPSLSTSFRSWYCPPTKETVLRKI